MNPVPMTPFQIIRNLAISFSLFSGVCVDIDIIGEEGTIPTFATIVGPLLTHKIASVHPRYNKQKVVQSEV